MKNPIVVNLLTFLALQWLSKTQATHFRHAIITWAPANSYSDTVCYLCVISPFGNSYVQETSMEYNVIAQLYHSYYKKSVIPFLYR